MHCWTFMVVVGAALLAPLQSWADGSTEFKIWAMEAHVEGRDTPHFEEGLEAVREAVKALKFDTYLKLKTDEHTFTDDRAYDVAINEQYTLEASAPEAAEGGRYRMNIKITMDSKTSPGTEIEALNTELLLLPGKKVVVRGLKLGEGDEMVIVLSLALTANTPQN